MYIVQHQKGQCNNEQRTTTSCPLPSLVLLLQEQRQSCQFEKIVEAPDCSCKYQVTHITRLECTVGMCEKLSESTKPTWELTTKRKLQMI